MKKLLSLLIIIATLFSLASCGTDDGVPTGMQIVRAGDDVGYYFYAPEEWTVANIGEISAAYASVVDFSSVTYTETDVPTVSLTEYFDMSLSEFTITPTVITYAEAVTFGSSDSYALRFVYELEYSDHKFKVMQILSLFEDRFGIFTFNSYNEPISSDEPQYDYYMTRVDSIINNFKYVSKADTPKEDAVYEKDADGYILISDKSVCGFDLFVPEDFKTHYSSGIVQASVSDGSNITMSRITSYASNLGEYFADRKAELSKIVGEITETEEIKALEFGNANQAAAYKYTYTYGGVTYCVYQVGAITSRDVYIFTYTAKEENFDKHFEIIEKISDKVVF